jgi:hypothetical protein
MSDPAKTVRAELVDRFVDLRLRALIEQERADSCACRSAAAWERGDSTEAAFHGDWARTLRVEVLRLQGEMAALAQKINHRPPLV